MFLHSFPSWRWFYLITTICWVRSCSFHRDWKEDSVGQKTLHSAKKCASCCLESCFHLCSSLYSTSLALEPGMMQRQWVGDLIHSFCLPYVSVCVHACICLFSVHWSYFILSLREHDFTFFLRNSPKSYYLLCIHDRQITKSTCSHLRVSLLTHNTFLNFLIVCHLKGESHLAPVYLQCI